MIKMQSLNSLGAKRSIGLMIFVSLALVITAFVISTYYLAYNETRIGIKLYDPVIAAIPPVDLSRAIFICTYSTILLGLFCSMTSPEKIIRTNLCILSLLLYRLVTMYLLPLEPPENIIPLQDEFLMYTTYGHKVLLKDLFFSGHTASVVLLYHLVDHKWTSRLLLIMSFIIGTMLIVQHVHYTIDVLVAYAFAHLSYKSGLWLTEKSLLYTRFLFIKPNILFGQRTGN